MTNENILLNNLNRFNGIGSPVENRILSFLIQNPSEWTAKKLCTSLSINDSKIYLALNSLEEKGIIGKTSYKRPAKYYFKDPVALHTYLETEIERKHENNQKILQKTMDLTYKFWNPNKPQLGNIAYIYRGSDIDREINRLWKLTQHSVTILLAEPGSVYIESILTAVKQKLDTLDQKLKIKISIPNQLLFSDLISGLNQLEEENDLLTVNKKISIWLGNSYLIADDTMMLNIIHNSQQDVAMLTNDKLLVTNIDKCWTDDSCCVVPSTVQLEINI